MPQKINPWKTEGAETFIEFANAELGVFDLLARQRKQGDLRRSVLKRYISVPMENIVIAIGRIREDFEKSYPNYTGIEREFAAHPEISSASVQSILRANGVPYAYDMMVEKTKGREVTPQMMESIVDDLVRDKVIANAVGDDIKTVFIHEKNIGDALKKADQQLGDASETIERIRRVYSIN